MFGIYDTRSLCGSIWCNENSFYDNWFYDNGYYENWYYEKSGTGDMEIIAILYIFFALKCFLAPKNEIRVVIIMGYTQDSVDQKE